MSVLLSTKRPRFALDEPPHNGPIELPFHGAKRVRTDASVLQHHASKDYAAMEVSTGSTSPPSKQRLATPRQHRPLAIPNKPLSPTLRSLDLSAYKSRLFTWDEVNRIVALAVKEREEVLKREYEGVLNEKLAEQFESFTQFNQDHIHRQMKESTYDYMA